MGENCKRIATTESRDNGSNEYGGITMNLNNITAGMNFGDYGELCRSLGEEEKVGMGKFEQLKEWDRHFLVEPSWTGLYIKKVYDAAKERNLQKNPFLKCLKTLILNKLVLHGAKWKKQTLRQWFYDLGMVINGRFDECLRTSVQETLASCYSIHCATLEKVWADSEKMCKELLMNAVLSLKCEGLLEFRYKYKSAVGKMPIVEWYDGSLNAETDRLQREEFERQGWEELYVQLDLRCTKDVVRQYASIDIVPVKNELCSKMMNALCTEVWRDFEEGQRKETCENMPMFPENYIWEAEFVVNRFIANPVTEDISKAV